MKVGPKEQQIRMLGPSDIERQYASPLRAGYTERQRKQAKAALAKLPIAKPKSNTPVSLTAAESNTPAESNKFDRKAYQRDLMRKRRAAAKTTS